MLQVKMKQVGVEKRKEPGNIRERFLFGLFGNRTGHEGRTDQLVNFICFSEIISIVAIPDMEG